MVPRVTTRVESFKVLFPRFKYLEAGSVLCDNDKFFLKNINKDEPRMKSSMSFAEKAKRYSMDLLEPSFCYEQQNFVMMSRILTYHGLCYAFNIAENMIDKST
jgi:hypothetical protein